MATRTQRAPSVKRPQPPYSALYSRTTARTKARKEKRSETGKHKLIYAAKDARALSEMEWRCVMLTWAVTGWRCKCPPERLSRFTCNCMPSWTPAEASVQHIATSKGAPRNLFNFWTGEAPRPAASGGREVSQLVGSGVRRTAYANLTVGCETYWTAVADSQLLGVEPPMQLTRYWNNNGRGDLERTKAVMFAGVGGILRPERAAQLQELRYRLGVLHQIGEKMDSPLLTCSVEETVQGLGAWLKGWNPCSSKWKPGLKRASSIMASPAAPAAREDDEKRTRTGVSANSKAKRRRRDPAVAGSSTRPPADFAAGRPVVDGTATIMGEDLPPGVRNPLAPATGTVLAVDEARHGMPEYVNFAAAAFEDRTLEAILRSGASSRLTPSSTPEAQALRAHCLAVVYLLDAMQENYRRWQMRPAAPAPVDAAAAASVATMASSDGTAVTAATATQTAGAVSAAGTADGAVRSGASIPSVQTAAEAAMERDAMDRSISDWAAIHMALCNDASVCTETKAQRERRGNRIAKHLQGSNDPKVRQWRNQCQRVCACLRAGVAQGTPMEEVLRGVSKDFFAGLTPSVG